MPPPVSIRRCGPADEAALALIGQATFLETFAGTLDGRDILAHCLKQHAVEKYRGWLGDPRSHLWLAETGQGAAPVGYLVLTAPDLPLPGLTSADLEVKRIYLLSRFHGGGIGRDLMHAAAAAARSAGARQLHLGVYSGNEAAMGFYQRLGFVRSGERTFQVGANTYHDFIFSLSLAEAPRA